MRKMIILLPIFLVSMGFVASHENDYSAINSESVLQYKSNSSGVPEYGPIWGFKDFSVKIGIFDESTVKKILGEMTYDLSQFGNGPKHNLRYIKNYKTNLRLLRAIATKTRDYDALIYHNLSKILGGAVSLYHQADNSYEKSELINIISNSFDLLFSKDSDVSTLLINSRLCKNFDGIVSYMCYQKFILSFSDKTPKEIGLATSILSNRQNTWDCHFLLHDLGISIGQKYSVAESYDKCGNFNSCTFGCQHGVAIGYLIRNKGRLQKLEFTEFSSKNPVNSSPAVLNLYHGFGHGFFGLYNDSEALYKCRLMGDIIGDPKVYNLCIVGGAHEKFFIETELYFENFSNDFDSCKEFGDHAPVCQMGTAYGYSQEGIWKGDTSLEPVSRTLEFCAKLNNEFCFYGVAISASVISADRYKNLSFTESFNQGIRDCIQLFRESNLSDEHLCNAGAGIFRLVFHQDLDSAFFACNVLDDKIKKSMCLRNINKFFEEYSMHGKIQKNLCNFLRRSKNECNELI